jgi:hypothetical protein
LVACAGSVDAKNHRSEVEVHRRAEVATDLRGIFDSPVAEKYERGRLD